MDFLINWDIFRLLDELEDILQTLLPSVEEEFGLLGPGLARLTFGAGEAAAGEVVGADESLSSAGSPAEPTIFAFALTQSSQLMFICSGIF